MSIKNIRFAKILISLRCKYSNVNCHSILVGRIHFVHTCTSAIYQRFRCAYCKWNFANKFLSYWKVSEKCYHKICNCWELKIRFLAICKFKHNREIIFRIGKVENSENSLIKHILRIPSSYFKIYTVYLDGYLIKDWILAFIHSYFMSVFPNHLWYYGAWNSVTIIFFFLHVFAALLYVYFFKKYKEQFFIVSTTIGEKDEECLLR